MSGGEDADEMEPSGPFYERTLAGSIPCGRSCGCLPHERQEEARPPSVM